MQDEDKNKIEKILMGEFVASSELYQSMNLQNLESVYATVPLLFMETITLLSQASEKIRVCDFQTARRLRNQARAIYRAAFFPDGFSLIAMNFDAALDAELAYFMSVKPEEKRKSWVYFVLSTDLNLVKIGTSVDVYKRLRTLETQSGNKLTLLKCIYGDHLTESELHRKFTAKRSVGEWFHYDKELKSYIDKIEGVTDC